MSEQSTRLADRPSEKGFSVTIKCWRQAGPTARGSFETHRVHGVNPDMSFLEMLDGLNDQLIRDGREPIAFDSDCREGICGTCGFMINKQPHGPLRNTATCQLRMRSFRDGDVLVLEPFGAAGFPVLKDLIVDRSSFDRIQQSGGYVSVNVGGAPDGNALPISKKKADAAMAAAACIGCGACVAACKNASASLFTGAKLSHLANLPQGQAERHSRTLDMVAQMDAEGFGSCTNTNECQAACPADISVLEISRMNRQYLGASLAGD